MKILEIIPVLFDGGAERFIVDLSNQMSEMNDTEVVLVSFYGNEKENFLVGEVNTKIRLIELGKRPGFDANLIPKLYKLIKKEQPDIVHSHLRAFEYLLPLMVLCKAKFVHTIHNDAFKECPGKISRLVRKLFFRFNHCIPVTISKDSSISYRQAYGNNENVEITNGRPVVEKSKDHKEVIKSFQGYRITDETKVIVNIARITAQKNQLLLIKVFNRLVKEGENIVLLILGRVEDKGIFNEINKIKNDRVYILNSKSNPIDYLYEADAFCLSSFYEGMPITLIESFQTACIPICTPAGGVRNMIKDGYNGFLADKIDEVSLISKFHEFLSTNQEDLIVIRKNCLQTFNKSYQISATSKKYIQLFQSLLTAKS